MNIKILRKIIKEEIGRNLRTYDPNNPTGTISNELKVLDFITVIENENTKNGKNILLIKVKKNIENKNIENELNSILPVKFEFIDYNSLKHKKNIIIDKIYGKISKYLWM